MEDRKIIGIITGDSANIGPGITAKVLANQSICEACGLTVVGDAYVLEAVPKIVGREEMTVRAAEDVRDAVFTHGTIDVLDMDLASIDELVRGQVSVMCGDAASHYVKRVTELAMGGQADATVISVFNKEAMNLAGYYYSGHTGVYADLTRTKNYTMVLAHGNVRVVHIFIHVSLREACDRTKEQRMLDVIRIGDRIYREMGVENPRITVAGLNPHSGGHGLFGQEKIQEITLVTEAIGAEGVWAEGLVSPDTVFFKARGGWYDIVVAMYHDQGHILPKVVGLACNQERQAWDTVADVNITLGLPVTRVSVGHGTAFDQMGTGTASELSLGNSLEYTVIFVRNWK